MTSAAPIEGVLNFDLTATTNVHDRLAKLAY